MKFISLVSSGIDSPIATFLVSKKADKIILVHGDNRPFTDDREIENFVKLAKHLKKIIFCNVEAVLVPHGESLIHFKENCSNRFTCVFCKRMLLRYAERIAEKEKADAIIMGDSLGQVASQTLQNIRVIDQAVFIPVLRPLIGFDKEESIRIAKEIGTYDLSILQSSGCSAVPNKPSTMAKLETILEEENKMEIEKLVKKSIKDSKQVRL